MSRAANSLNMQGITWFLICFFLSCTPTHAANENIKVKANAPQHVVLMSLDGFRHDYVELHNAKHLNRIAKDGIRSASLTPVYPANTFPNHISLVTGLLPKNHGIVNNRFYDKSRPYMQNDMPGYAQYKLGGGLEDSTWITGIPLWTLAEYHGLKAGAFFWPESDARISGALPTYHYHYSKFASYQQRIDQIVQWMSLPEVSRPRFVAGYFSLTDTIGHNEGPNSQATRDAVQFVDGLIGQLYDRLNALEINVNLVVVSDHGMTNIDNNALIDVATLNISDNFIAENEGAQIHLYALPGVSDDEISREKERLNAISQGKFLVLNDSQRAYRAMQKGDRTGDILLEIAPPARFVSGGQTYSNKGSHGYLNTLPDMGALFIAAGPAFKKGATLPAFSNLEIYPALAKILGITPLSPIDGKIDVLEDAFTL